MTMVSGRMVSRLGLLAAVTLAGCSASPAPSSAPTGHSRSVTPVASASAAPVPATSSTPATKDGIRNLAVSQDVRNELTTAYAKYRGISPADIVGITAGSLHYAYEPATHAYWAEANFLPSPTAPAKVLVGFQDGASIGLFTRQGTGSWQVRLAGEPPVCNEVRFLPHAVMLAWSLSTDAAAWGC
jgi:hypothetical protein